MPVSCNSIFHYTPSLENLKSIIGDKSFKVNYCFENICIGNQDNVGDARFDIAVPMVCFCDIPFTNVNEHTKMYGSYGIGLSKEWAKSKQINPVLYFEKKSRITEILGSVDYLTERLNTDPLIVKQELESVKHLVKHLDQNIKGFLGYIKNYCGDLTRTGKKTIKDYEFYKEREWRYVPKSLGNKISLLKFSKYRRKKKQYNMEANKERLLFEYDDISYIVLMENSQIEDFTKFIHSKADSKTANLLCAKIITLEQISKDF